jgi:sterol desaturase/sphingolipid hydroxylase (fatty acid hydroxylase superfamily)
MENIIDLLLCLLVILHEFGLYASHRLMHEEPFLYKYHKIHHEFKMNVTMTAQNNHIVDYFFNATLHALLALSVTNPHSLTLFQWIIWTVVVNLDDHAEYDFLWSRFHSALLLMSTNFTILRILDVLHQRSAFSTRYSEVTRRAMLVVM